MLAFIIAENNIWQSTPNLSGLARNPSNTAPVCNCPLGSLNIYLLYFDSAILSYPLFQYFSHRYFRSYVYINQKLISLMFKPEKLHFGRSALNIINNRSQLIFSRRYLWALLPMVLFIRV